MNKKGLTLVELLAVIVILSLLSLIVVPSINNLRIRFLNDSYDDKVRLIEIAAADYGTENLNSIPGNINCDKDYYYNHMIELSSDDDRIKYKNIDGTEDSSDCFSDCLTIKVGYLIVKGYLVADDEFKTSLINPLSGASMNNEYVCIRYDSKDLINRKVEAYMIGKNKYKYND